MADSPRDQKTGFSPFVQGLKQSTSTLTEFYEVRDGPVLLTIHSPASQVTGSSVYLEDSALASGQIEKLVIGQGRDLRGTVLKVLSTAKTISPVRNVSLRYVLSGGASEREFELNGAVEGLGDRHVFVVSFLF